jgi:hypothetical protein
VRGWSLGLAAVLVSATLSVPSGMAAMREWPRRLSVLLPGAGLSNRYVQDVAEAPDGSILVAIVRGWLPRAVRCFGGIVRAADGSIVMVRTPLASHPPGRRDANRRRDRRAAWLLEGRLSSSPSNGEGGPALRATLCLPSDVIVAADGGYIVTDLHCGTFPVF